MYGYPSLRPLTALVNAISFAIIVLPNPLLAVTRVAKPGERCSGTTDRCPPDRVLARPRPKTPGNSMRGNPFSVPAARNAISYPWIAAISVPVLEARFATGGAADSQIWVA